jgi:hypothetical protein
MSNVSLLPRSGPSPDKIQRRHRERAAMVYIRQSTPQQVERHQESTRLQYALVDRAFQFGWARESIVVIDDDLGRSVRALKAASAFSDLLLRLDWAMSGLCWAWRCRGWLALAETGLRQRLTRRTPECPRRRASQAARAKWHGHGSHSGQANQDRPAARRVPGRAPAER